MQCRPSGGETSKPQDPGAPQTEGTHDVNDVLFLTPPPMFIQPNASYSGSHDSLNLIVEAILAYFSPKSSNSCRPVMNTMTLLPECGSTTSLYPPNLPYPLFQRGSPEEVSATPPNLPMAR